MQRRPHLPKWPFLAPKQGSPLAGLVRTDAWSWGECKAIQNIGLWNSWSSSLCPPGLPVTGSHLLDRTLQLALGHTVAPATLLTPSPPAELRAEAGPSSAASLPPPPPSAPSSLLSLAQVAPSFSSPCSVSHRGSYPKPMFRKPSWCSNLQAAPRRVRTAGHESVERRQLRPECLSRWNQGPRRQHPAPPPSPPAPYPPPRPSGAQPSAPQLTGMFVREAISEGVLWLGQPRERQR